jgi:HTH-type transcriptional regulator, transcriptional repressor of NAD biosynthesis genes
VEYYQDGTRLSEEERDKLDSFHRRVIKEANLSVVEISGSWEERFQQAVEQIRLLII